MASEKFRLHKIKHKKNVHFELYETNFKNELLFIGEFKLEEEAKHYAEWKQRHSA
jgi:tRNA A37 threonylcarbamoyladenosine biosynthesis protein TsaE